MGGGGRVRSSPDRRDHTVVLLRHYGCHGGTSRRPRRCDEVYCVSSRCTQLSKSRKHSWIALILPSWRAGQQEGWVTMELSAQQPSCGKRLLKSPLPATIGGNPK